MKISLNWLRSYLDFDLGIKEVADLLTEIGLEVEGIEAYEQVKGGMEGIIIGEVKSCAKHPNADRLSLTTVDVGNGDLLQIVCGAPNITSGQKVTVATVGTTLYDKEGKPWKIKKGKIRGEVSEGMICAADEIGMGEDHSGIMVLNDQAVIGTAAKDYFALTQDTILEIGLTPNRSDATCHLGVARDLAAALQINFGFTGQVREPDLEGWQEKANTEVPKVSVKNYEACPRFTGVLLRDLQVKPSPPWLTERLLSIGVRPINNVVDATNFVLHEMGQPLHAYDWDRVGNREVRVQTLPEGSKFTTLDEQEHSLASGDLMICDGNDAGMCIAGVFGGVRTGVTDETKDIFLEAAHFDSRWVRRTSSRHLLFTDAAWIFEKGSDPNICVKALKRAAMLICELSGGHVASEVVDIYPQPVQPFEIELSYPRLNQLVGTSIEPANVMEILNALNIEILSDSPEGLRASIPTSKSDVTREVDLIEEVLRIYGYNRVPVQAQMSFAVHSQPQPDSASIKNRISDYLVSVGFHEMMAMSMLDNRYVGEVIENRDKELIRINNTSHIHMEVMRPDMLVSALEAVKHNQNRQQTRIRLFEFGKSYRKVQDRYLECDHLTITLYGRSHESWLQEDLADDREYFVLKRVGEQILTLLGLDRWEIAIQSHPNLASGVQYRMGEDAIAHLGVVSSRLCTRMDVKGPVFYIEFDWNKLLDLAKVDQIKVKPLSRFPSVRRDLAVVVDKAVLYSDIRKSIVTSAKDYLEEINLFDVYLDDDSLGEGKKSYALSLTLKNPDKTFSDREIDQIIQRILKGLKRDVDARLR